MVDYPDADGFIKPKKTAKPVTVTPTIADYVGKYSSDVRTSQTEKTAARRVATFADFEENNLEKELDKRRNQSAQADEKDDPSWRKGLDTLLKGREEG